VLGVVVGGGVLLAVLAYFAGALAGHIPFSAERALAAHFAPIPDANAPLQRYLQQLAGRIAKAEHLPADMSITVHYVDSDTVNAFATLGGHVVFFRGLLERMPNENALAMVMAHEIAHVKTRAPLKSMGRGMVIAAALTVVDSSLGTRLAGNVLGQAGLLTQLGFSREQESEADRIGQAALVACYGGTIGADDLFHVLQQVSPKRGERAPALYRSHPDAARRIAALHRQARAHGWPPGGATALPAAFARWTKSGERSRKANRQTNGK
jgi:predicted Zn-dependent protease